MKLRAKTNPGGDQPARPCTPTKRGHRSAAEAPELTSPPKRFPLTPQRGFDSPKRWESPKSRFFDAGGSSELLSHICPKQFFDNSQLGAAQGESRPPSRLLQPLGGVKAKGWSVLCRGASGCWSGSER